MQTNQIIEAFEHLMSIVHRTPLKQSKTFNELTGANLFLKMENLQRTGSFKIRGALNKILSLNDLAAMKGVIAASAGNHAQGVALAAAKRGIQAKIFMPEDTPIAKVKATQTYGAEVVLTGESYQEAYEAACLSQQKSGATFVHAFDDIEVMAGQGTIALEMVQQCSELDAIVVPVGGGGLLAGVATLVKNLYPNIKMIGVQSTGALATYNRFHGTGKSRLIKVGGIADGILVKEPGQLTYPIINRYVDDMVSVTDEEIALAMIMMLEREKMFVEGAGAAALAAIFSKKIRKAGKNVGIIISGGNADLEKMPLFKSLANSNPMLSRIVS